MENGAVYLEGLKARGEACKVGGTMASILIAGLALMDKDLTCVGVIAIILLAIAVALAAFALMFGGLAASEPSATVCTVRKSGRLKAANSCGILEIVFLTVGLVLVFCELA